MPGFPPTVGSGVGGCELGQRLVDILGLGGGEQSMLEARVPLFFVKGLARWENKNPGCLGSLQTARESVG